HKQGIVHRDLKPGNVMILDDPPGRDLVKVLDFGLAKSLGREAMSKVTHSDALLGTPLYMAPEQIAGQPTDQRVDLYALGCMLHEMLSGAPAFGGTSIDRVLSNHLYELAAPLPPDVPPALAELIRRLIAKHPGDRPQSAAEVRRTLLGEAGPGSQVVTATTVGQMTSQVVARGPATMPSSADRVPRRRWWIGLIAALAGGTMAAAIAVSWQSRRPTHAAVLDAGAAPSDGAGGPSDAGGIANDAAARPGDAAASDAATAPIDARAPRDAALLLDATVPPLRPDAGAVIPMDAGRATVRPPRRPTRLEPDAGNELDFYRSDAGP
ncbi:MAG TPA: serine/threonine-protein kinase, partial [Kofleriaceae bacterium]|nr:serine/threonine-protein kinase [Kofleriaceae bacterium]